MKNKIKNLKQYKSPILSYKTLYNFNLKKNTITSFNNNRFSSYKKNILNKNNNSNTMKNTISDFYYKNPFFYNDNNLNIQLKVLKELEKLDLSQISTSTPTNTNYNTKNNSPTPFDKKFNINNKSIEKKVSRNIISLTDINSNSNLPNISNISNIKSKDNNDIKVEINENYINDVQDRNKKIKSKKYKSLEHNSYSGKKVNNFFSFRNTPKNLKENDDYFYKIVFKSKPLFKLDQKIVVDNKYNMIYAENEQQYKNIIEKEYKRLISEGKKVKSKNISTSIKLKLNEAKNKIKFMKGIMDYSYPGFVLSKINYMQKKLNEHKNKASYLNCLNGMEIRNEERKNRNQFRREYLLKSITILK